MELDLFGAKKRKKDVLRIIDNYLGAWVKASKKYGFSTGKLAPPHQDLNIYEEVLSLRKKIEKAL